MPDPHAEKGSIEKWTSTGQRSHLRSSFVCALPASDAQTAAQMLADIGRSSGGSGIGAGLRMNDIGVNMPAIRHDYKNEVERLVFEVERRLKAKVPLRSVAEFAVAERRAIATRMRARSGLGTRVLFEIRDWREYGAGGRSFENLERRYLQRGLAGDELYTTIAKGATKPNIGISEAAIRGARYLKYGGRVIVVVSVATTGYRLMTTPPQDMERVLHEEAGGLLGGAIGSGVAVGACLVFGVATGGWGLLACGVIGGGLGGGFGSWIGDKVYYGRHAGIEDRISRSMIVRPDYLSDSIPDQQCLAPLSSTTDSGFLRGQATVFPRDIHRPVFKLNNPASKTMSDQLSIMLSPPP